MIDFSFFMTASHLSSHFDSCIKILKLLNSRSRRRRTRYFCVVLFSFLSSKRMIYLFLLIFHIFFLVGWLKNSKTLHLEKSVVVRPCHIHAKKSSFFFLIIFFISLSFSFSVLSLFRDFLANSFSLYFSFFLVPLE